MLRAEDRQHVVLQRAAHRQRSSSPRTACPCRGAGRCGPARRRRATGRRASSKSGPRAASSRRCSLPASAAASQVRTSARFLTTGFCHSGLPVTGCRRRPRHEGVQRQRAEGSSYGRAVRRVRDVDARESGLAPVGHDPSRDERLELCPTGDTEGDTTGPCEGFRWGSLGSDGRPRIFAKGLLERRKRPRSGMPEEGLEPPTRGL